MRSQIIPYDQKEYFVYIMLRAHTISQPPYRMRQFRIGMTSDIKIRCNKEKAAAAWILLEFGEDKEQALGYEIWLAAHTGIPQTTFVGTEDNQKFIDNVWALVGDNWDRGIVTLEGFNKDLKSPTWRRKLSPEEEIERVGRVA
jgi:hypothetical protein